MADVFEEVDEELRQDRLKRLLRTYGPWVLGAVVLAIALAVGWTLWQNHQESQRAERTERLTQAIEEADNGNRQAAVRELSAFRDSVDSPTGDIAALYAAGLQAENGAIGEAAELYEGVAGDGANALYRSLGALMAGMAKFDRLDVDALRVELAPVLDGESPWRFTAKELVAHKLLAAGRTDEAGALFAELAEAEDAPTGLKQRVRPFSERYGG